MPALMQEQYIPKKTNSQPISALFLQKFYFLKKNPETYGIPGRGPSVGVYRRMPKNYTKAYRQIKKFMTTKHIRVKKNTNHSKFESLTGNFLVALPGFKSEDFQETVILICQHDATGAMGLVINQAITGVHLSDLIEHTSLLHPHGGNWQDQPVFWGGPVNVNQGFVLHSPDTSWPSTLEVNSFVSVTPHLDIFEENHTPKKQFPEHYRAVLGHVSWKQGQLEREWMHQAWLSMPYQEDFLFQTEPEKQWNHLLAYCGVQPMNFSPVHGRA